MSGEAEPLGARVGDELGPSRRGGSEVEEELRLHLDLIVEQLRSEGYGRADAEAEAQRRFGDLETLVVECAVQRAGPIGSVLRWLVSSTLSLWVVGALGVFAVWLTGDPWLALVGVLMPVAAAAGCCALLALKHETSTLPVRAGHRLLGLLFLLGVTTFLLSQGDWMHSLWSVQFPMIGLFLGSGLLLIRVWPEDRSSLGARGDGWKVALSALVGLLILGSLTFALLEYRAEPREAGDGAPFRTLGEVVHHGFGGDIPASMQPLHPRQIERGMGVPPRMVTVTMGSTLFAAIIWALFVLIALVGKTIWDARWRRSFLLTAPLFIAPALLLWSLNPRVYEGLWRNEPWFVNAYGPVLLLTVSITQVLLLQLWRSRRSVRPDGR